MRTYFPLLDLKLLEYRGYVFLLMILLIVTGIELIYNVL